MTDSGGELGERTLWHGRFASGPAEELMDYTVSLPFDRRLAADDITGSRAHVRGLVRGELLDGDEAAAVLAALDDVERELADGTFVFVPSDEDIHTAVERRVTEIAGPAAMSILKEALGYTHGGVRAKDAPRPGFAPLDKLALPPGGAAAHKDPFETRVRALPVQPWREAGRALR